MMYEFMMDSLTESIRWEPDFDDKKITPKTKEILAEYDKLMDEIIKGEKTDEPR